MKTSSLPPSADGFVPTWSCSRRGLPGHRYYYRCRWSFTPPFHSCYPGSGPSPNGKEAQEQGSDLFLWPSSGRLAPCGGFPAPGAIRRRALWSADFPRPRRARPRPSNRPEAGFIIPAQLPPVNIPLTFCQRAAKMIRATLKSPPERLFSTRSQT